MHFPVELLSIVANELRTDKPSLARLAQTSSVIYYLIAPLLYENVHLTTNESLEPFSRMVNKDTCEFGTRTQTLTLSSNITFTKDLADKFRTALESMSNLRELLLNVDSEGVDTCFDGLNAPFALQRLQVPVLSSPGFKSFISSQSSITELHFRHTAFWDAGAVRGIFADQPRILPNLNSISASLEMFSIMLPGRPVTEVMTLGEWESDSWGDIVEYVWHICRMSAVPVTTVGFYSGSHSHDPWFQLVPALRILDGHSYIKRFKIIEVFRDPHTDDIKRNILAQRVDQLRTLCDFEQLEAVEVVFHNGRKPSKSQVLEWLGEMSTVSAWKGYIPSLKQVTMYGVDLS